MLKTIIGKLERKKKKKSKAWLTQNPKTELKKPWVGLDS